jgi:hypothetical protein
MPFSLFLFGAVLRRSLLIVKSLLRERTMLDAYHERWQMGESACIFCTGRHPNFD